MLGQYWVIGGEFDSIDFANLVDGTCDVVGPFNEYHAAAIAWRELAFATRHKALTRYTIVSSLNVETDKVRQPARALSFGVEWKA